jgi:hypothetical protein
LSSYLNSLCEYHLLSSSSEKEHISRPGLFSNFLVEVEVAAVSDKSTGCRCRFVCSIYLGALMKLSSCREQLSFSPLIERFLGILVRFLSNGFALFACTYAD